MFRRIALATVATAALAAPAFAGSLAPTPIEPVPMAPAPVPMTYGGDWTGGYAGASLGYGDFDNGVVSGDGAVYGIHAGYDYDFGTFVMGGELEHQASDIDLAPGVNADGVTRLKLRAGYDAGRALVYGVAGAARANTSIGNDNGYVVGLGTEYKVTDNVSVGGEYLYHGFDNFAGTATDLDANVVSARVNYRF